MKTPSVTRARETPCLPPHPGSKVTDANNGFRLGKDRLRREQATIRQTPYEI